MTSTRTYIGKCQCPVCERWRALTIGQYEVLAAATRMVTSAPFLHGDDELWALVGELCELVRDEESLGALSSPVIVLPHLPAWFVENEERLSPGGSLAHYGWTVKLVRGALMEVLLAPWRVMTEGDGRARLIVMVAEGWDLSAEELLAGVDLASRGPRS
jgi:hypothetical protein